MSEIGAQIQRINEKWREYEICQQEIACRLSQFHVLEMRGSRICKRPRSTEQQVECFEIKYGVRLPEEYRRFLLEIGNGETFFSNEKEYNATDIVYGIKPGSTRCWAIKELTRCWKNMRMPFLQTKSIVWEAVELTEDEKRQIENLDHGNLRLCDHGCGMYTHLIVTGPERGHVWEICDVGSGPSNFDGPRFNFLCWYESIMDERINKERNSLAAMV